MPSVTVLRGETTPTIADPFGYIDWGYLELMGTLVPVELAALGELFKMSLAEYNGRPGQLTRTHEGQTTLVRRDGKHVYEVLCDEPVETESWCGESNKACWLNGKCQGLHIGCTCADVPADSTVYCLEIGLVRRKGEDISDLDDPDDFRWQVWWLVLRLSERKAGAFERIGIGYRNDTGYDRDHLLGGSQRTNIRLS